MEFITPAYNRQVRLRKRHPSAQTIKVVYCTWQLHHPPSASPRVDQCRLPSIQPRVERDHPWMHVHAVHGTQGTFSPMHWQGSRVDNSDAHTPQVPMRGS